MNYYERINRAIEFIESNLDRDFSIENAAKQAYMSISTFYRMFYSIAGFSVKEYIRRRRLSCAAEDLRVMGTQPDAPELRIIDIAVKYGYGSADAFTRSFKEEFGINPSKLKNDSGNLPGTGFRRIHIMDEYFELKDKDIVTQYPDIKLIKKLPDMKVACFKYFGPDPEIHAFAKMKEWVRQNGIHFNDKNNEGENTYRIFGFNNPDPVQNDSDCADGCGFETYGYEVCITIDPDLYETLQDAPPYGFRESYDNIMRKTLSGGMFAVVSIRRDKDGGIGTEIMNGWQRFNKWMELSKYMWGNRQYLEEHLEFSEDNDHTGGVDLYMPIREPDVKNIPAANAQQLIREDIPACRVVFYRATDNDSEKAAYKAWNVMLAFAKKHMLDANSTRIFMYGSGFNPNPPFFHEIMMTVPDNFTFQDKNVRIKEFSGGPYMTVMTDFKQLLRTWESVELWRKETKAGIHQWVQEFFLNGFDFPEQGIKVCYPVIPL